MTEKLVIEGNLGIKRDCFAFVGDKQLLRLVVDFAKGLKVCRCDFFTEDRFGKQYGPVRITIERIE